MVKLVSVRETRLYGPRQTRGTYEYFNAVAYICATVLLMIGFVLLLPGFNPFAALIILIIALATIILVNLHDLYAQVAGFDFRLPLFIYDPQLALIEVAAPLYQTIGGIFFLIGAILIFQTRNGTHFPDIRSDKEHDALPFLIAGAVLWFIGSITNAFQVFQRASLRAQALQKAVSLPFLVASTLLFINSLLLFENWRGFVDRKTYSITGGFAIAAAVLMVVGGIVNAVRIGELQDMDRRGGFLGQERREQGRPFLEPGMGSTDIESEAYSYKEAVIR